MSPPLTRRNVLAAGSTVGIGSLAACQELLGSPTSNSSDGRATDDGAESLGLAYSRSSSAFPSDEEAHSGWVHIVSDGESADLTFDVRFCSELGDIEPALVHSIADEYVLRFSASAGFEEPSTSETTADSGCNSVTHLVGGANVPRDWETLTVAVNDVDIRSVERSGTMPELRPLPDPVRPR